MHVPYATDHSGGDDHGGIDRGGLQHSSDDHPYCAKADGPASSKFLSDSECQKGAATIYQQVQHKRVFSLLTPRPPRSRKSTRSSTRDLHRCLFQMCGSSPESVSIHQQRLGGEVSVAVHAARLKPFSTIVISDQTES